MAEKVALYARVSTKNQSLDNQNEKLMEWFESQNDYTEYDLYSEKVSSVKQRPKFEEMMEKLEEYDLIVVTKIDRFGRSLRDILTQIDKINENGSALLTIDDNFQIDTRGEQGLQQEIMTKFLSLFADIERRMIRMRMNEGYRKAQEEGKVGRPKKTSDEQDEEIYRLYNEEGMSMANIKYHMNGKYEDLNLSKSAVQRAKNRVEELKD